MELVPPIYEQASAEPPPKAARRHQRREATHWSAAAWRLMYQALDIARSAEGLSWPNPPVGCLIVRDAQITGTGGSHTVPGLTAEAVALGAAGDNPASAEAYLSMEPTCPEEERAYAALFLRSGISRVYIATEHPHPDHAGRAIAALRAAGLSVYTGYCQHDAKVLLRPYRKWVATGLPYVTSASAAVFDRPGQVDPRPFDAVAQSAEAGIIELALNTRPGDEMPPEQELARSRCPASIKIARCSADTFLNGVGRTGIYNLAVTNTDELGIELARYGHIDAFL